MNNIKERFDQILKETLQLTHQSLLREVTFAELGADSLDEVELVMAVEEEFGIEIPDDEAEKMKTIGEAFDYIKRHTA